MPTSPSTVRRQQASLTTADNWGDSWTSADLDFLAGCPEIPAHELAEALGRSLYAVHLARRALADRPATALTSRRRPTPRPQRTWTFIGDDVPEGW
jgi:hypothetical protein